MSATIILLLVIASVAAITSLSISVIYTITREVPRWRQKRSQVKPIGLNKVTISTIDGTIELETTPEDIQKVLQVLVKDSPDDTSLNKFNGPA